MRSTSSTRPSNPMFAVLGAVLLCCPGRALGLTLFPGTPMAIADNGAGDTNNAVDVITFGPRAVPGVGVVSVAGTLTFTGFKYHFSGSLTATAGTGETGWIRFFDDVRNVNTPQIGLQPFTFDLFMDGTATAAAGLNLTSGQEFLSIAAYSTNAHMSDWAYLTWRAATNNQSEPINSNSYPSSVPFYSRNAGVSTTVFAINFDMITGDTFTFPASFGVNTCIEGLGFDCFEASTSPPESVPGPPIPEPSTLLLFGTGLAGLAALRKDSGRYLR